jgi:nickel/cobalt transporter (NicO) family protein
MTDALSAVYFPAAVALGALHALEPGHAKALTAAYLIGIKGTKRDSVVLGLSVAATHSIVVIAISAIGIWIGKEAFAGQATHWLEMASGMVAISIGSWMLWRRLFKKGRLHKNTHQHFKSATFSATTFPTISPTILMTAPTMKASPRRHSHKQQEHNHDHDHGHDHAHMDDIAHAQAHAAALPEYAKTGERPSLGQIALFGAAGGMIPCPASITVMLLALSTGRAGMGIFTVLGFSLGLAIALVGIGLIVVSGLSQLSHTGRFSTLISKAPVVSASLVIVSGLFALIVAR